MLSVCLKMHFMLGFVPARPVPQPPPLAVVLVLPREGVPAALPRSPPLPLRGDQAQALCTTHSLTEKLSNHVLPVVMPPAVILSITGL